MKGLLGKKVGMTQIFGDGGVAVPVTVIQAGPCTVVQKKTREGDGYEALQLGFEPVKERKVNEPLRGHFAKAQVKPQRHLREVGFSNPDDYRVGAEIKADLFKAGDHVDVRGISKGKGFQGGMKRHRFGGGPNSHGSMSHRRPASAGDTNAAKVPRGKRSPGHMGSRQVAALGLRVVRVDPEKNLLLVRGSVPGSNGSLVVISLAQSHSSLTAKEGSQISKVSKIPKISKISKIPPQAGQPQAGQPQAGQPQAGAPSVTRSGKGASESRR